MDPIQFYGTATVGSKGQIVIPAEAREKIGLAEGSKLVIMSAPMGDGIVAIKAERVASMMKGMSDMIKSATEQGGEE